MTNKDYILIGLLVIMAVASLIGFATLSSYKARLIAAQQTTLETVANYDQAKIDFDLQMTVLQKDNDFLTEDNLRQQALIAAANHIDNQNEAIRVLKAELDKYKPPDTNGMGGE